MTIRTVYVYASISGTIGSTGNGYYCSGGTHSPCNSTHSKCVDIIGSGTIKLIVNYPYVRSFYTTITYECAPGCADKYRRLLTLDLYGDTNQTCYVGTVAYGHVDTPYVTNGSVGILTSGTYSIGTVPSGSCGTWYTGPHSHMEMAGGTLMSLSCNQTVGSSTAIYSFRYDDIYCS